MAIKIEGSAESRMEIRWECRLGINALAKEDVVGLNLSTRCNYQAQGVA